MAFSRSKTNASDEKKKRGDDGSVVTQSRLNAEEAAIEEAKDTVEDAVFGEQGGEDTVNYRSLGWIGASVLIVKSQVGVGVLSLPSAFGTLGLVPGLLVFFFFAITTGWTDYYIGVFKMNHPGVYSLSDCGELMFGPVGREVFGVAYWFFCTMTAGSAFLTLSTGLNAISLHGACTAIFVAIAAIVTFPLASIRTLDRVRWLGWPALISIISAVLVALIAIATGRPSLAPQTGPYTIEVVKFGNPSFANGMNAVASIFFAFSGTPAFLPIASELRNPRDYKKAVILGQGFVVVFYLVVATVVYVEAGQYVASPALGTAGVLIKRISYGLALPGLFFTAFFYTHLPAKWMFFRILRNSHHLTHGTKTHWVVWLACTGGCTLFSYIISSAVPTFNGLVGLISALFGTMLTLNAEALMYLYDNRSFLRGGSQRSMLKTLGIAFNISLLVVASFILVAGTYGSAITIKEDAAEGGKPWSCADNSGSV
ncbi:hypothetical protein JCM10207_007757 [Rhodosporidiobolus poonsookiae]